MPRLLNVSKRIVLLSLLTILLTGLLVGLSTSLPMYKSIRSHIEQVSLSHAAGRGAALENHFSRYHSLAGQFTSRTEIRKRLEAYLSGGLSLDEVREFSQPRLAEPAGHIDDLRAMVRLTRQGEVVAAVGELAGQVSALDLSDARQKIISLPDADEDLVRVSAPIRSPGGELLGMDVLYFDVQSMLSLLGNFSTYGEQARLYLLDEDFQRSLSLDAGQRRVVREEVDPAWRAALNARDLQRVSLFGLADVMLVYVPLAQEQCGLLISIPQAVFYQAAYQDLLWAYLSVLVMLVVGAAISYYMVKPLIDKLTRQAAKIEQDAMELRLAASVFEQTRQAIIISDSQLNIVRANPGARHILVAGEDRLLQGFNLKEFLAEDLCDNPQLQNNTFQGQLRESNSWQGEVCYKKPDGSQDVIPTLQSVTPVMSPAGQISYLIHVFTDITERKEAESRITHMAHHDPLTGLPNRNALMHRLAHCVSSMDCFSVLFIDLDKFKPVNDTLGHQAGDELLRQVARRIRDSVRQSDTLGRFGGDEFVMLVESARDGMRADIIAEKIIRQVTQPYDIGGHAVSIGVSIGIASFPKDADSMDGIINAADAAMYQAKEAGGNRFAFYADTNQA